MLHYGSGGRGFSRWMIPTTPHPPGKTKWGLLTQKQRQITALLVEGKQCKEIAAQLGTTCQVIKNSVVLIYDKLGVRNRYDLLKALLEFPPTCESASMEPRAPKM